MGQAVVRRSEAVANSPKLNLDGQSIASVVEERLADTFLDKHLSAATIVQVYLLIYYLKTLQRSLHRLPISVEALPDRIQHFPTCGAAYNRPVVSTLAP
jgi:DNA/RNA-binding domain of Phe-tRNA-synthetase-like protein